MPNVDFHLRIGDTLPDWHVILQDSEGPLADLDTAQSIKLKMKKYKTDAPLVVDAAAVLVDAVTAEVRYPWSNGKPTEEGFYEAVFEVVTAEGAIVTCPNTAPLIVKAYPDF